MNKMMKSRLSSIISIICIICIICVSKGDAFSPQTTGKGSSIRTTTRTNPSPSRTEFIKDQTSDLDFRAILLDKSLVLSPKTSSSLSPSSSVSTSSTKWIQAIQSSFLPVVSTSLLITGNTVGASMLVLPELAQTPGMAISTGVLGMAYVMNWMSGLCIAQVAIHQNEVSGDDVPSSFKEFAQANLGGDDTSENNNKNTQVDVASLVSAISIFVNSLVLAFDTTKAGDVLQSIQQAVISNNFFPMQLHTIIPHMEVVWAIFMFAIVSTQSLERLSQVASWMVMAVFISFGGLLLPGLAHVSDPWTVLTSGPLPPAAAATVAADSRDQIMDSILHMTPVFVTSLVYQNIVPTVTRILDYDRTKVITAITVGSFLPFCIYIAWCVAVLGGGIDTQSFAGSQTGSGTNNAAVLFTLFSTVTVAGSSMGALMSLAEEFEILLNDSGTTTSTTSSSSTPPATKQDSFSIPSVAVPSIIALMVCQWFADDISGALKVAGSYGSPLLYGIIPVTMAYVQQNQQEQQQQQQSILPGGLAGMGLLGLGACALIGTELCTEASHLIVAS